MGRLNQLVDRLDEEHFATAVYAVLDPASGDVRYANAGHPPPLLVTADGTTTYLRDGLSVPLGAVADAEFSQATTRLPAGATLVLYTDGLIENRSVHLDHGMATLATETRRAATAPLDELIDCALAHVPGGDDVAVLAVRSQRLPAVQTVALRFPAEAASVPAMRRELRSFLASLGADADETFELVLAACEAATNAIEHAQDPIEPAFEVTLEAADRDVAVTVRDFGQWRGRQASMDRGRGSTLMSAYADIEMTPGAEGTSVTIRRQLTAP